MSNNSNSSTMSGPTGEQGGALVNRWHEWLESKDLAGLPELLAEDSVFHSPVVHTPQQGRALVTMYLSGAFFVLGDAGFRYVREVVDGSNAVLEFEAELDGIHINGVDMIHWNADGLIDDFKVMIRPLKAVNMLHRMMAQALEQMGDARS
jgi:hypothetical protein